MNTCDYCGRELDELDDYTVDDEEGVIVCDECCDAYDNDDEDDFGDLVEF